MDARWPLDVSALGSAACGVRLWKGPKTRHLTVVVKALVKLVHDGRGTVVPGAEIIVKDRHYAQSPGRSVEEAAELAPYLARCDVTLRGHAFPPPGQAVPAMTVRLGVFRSAPILDKKLFVFGDAQPATPQERTPFQRMPLDYEHAYGGKSHAPNPVGRGSESKGSGALPPNVVDAVDPKRSTCFAPLSRFWGERAKALGTASRKLVDADEAEIAEGFDWRYFQAAPADQQVPYLSGDEWIVMDGMHPALPRVQTQLPSIRGAALVYTFGDGGYGPARPMELLADTLAIDADRLGAAMIWRGSMVLDPAVDLARLKVFGAVELAGSPVAWPDPRSLEPPQARAPEVGGAPAAGIDGGATRALTSEQAAEAARALANPFAGQGGRPVAPLAPAAPQPSVAFGETVSAAPDAAARPVAPFRIAATPDAPPPVTPFAAPPPTVAATPFAPPSAPIAPPAPPPVAPPAPAPARVVDFSATRTLSSAEAELAARIKVDPFAAQGDQPFVPPAAPRPPPRDESELGGTITLTAEALERANKQVLPFLLERSERTSRARKPAVAQARAVPRRESPQVPIVNVTPLIAVTTPWQVRPPQDSLTLIVKGTCDLVPGAPAKLREEADPPTGDIHADDELERSLVYPSDFAIMKPRADVVLTGHACATKGPVTHARVTLKFGEGSAPRGFERAIIVVGDRTWKKKGPIALSPGDPAPFERMPLVHERAFGGAVYAPNPLGTGQNGTALPNLEDPSQPITSPGDVPPTACFAPIPPLWKERRSKLGTYTAEWLAARWPYFPGDFDWSHFQAAPRAQQVDHLRGDEPYEIAGMHAEHPLLRGSLPGVRVRAFALETEAEGGELFEIPLRLDTAAFDVDEMKVNLVWRGLFETSDDEAPEIETLFIHTEELASEPLALDEVKRLHAPRRQPDARRRGGGAPDSPSPRPPDPEEIARTREAVIARLASGEPFDGVDLAGASLLGLDFTGRSLASANLKDATLRGSRFSGTDLSGALLAGADLTECDLTGARLTDADLVEATLERAVLDGADLGGADLSSVKADGASFKKVRGEGVHFAGGSFRDARFDGAELPSADFTETKLDRAIFEDAILPEVRLYYAEGEAARFDRARLDEARCDDCKLVRTSFAGVNAPSSVWEKATLSASVFATANLAGASFSRAICDGTIFLTIDAPESRFMRANLTGAQFLKANLMQADLERADLTGADLRGANLHGAETWKAKLVGAKLDLAIVTRSKLKGRA